MKMANTATCVECGKKFEYSIVGTIYPGGKEKEDIICPYCNAVNGHEMTSAFVESKRIEESQE